MYKVSEFTKETYCPRDVAALLGVTVKTIRDYEQAGKIKAFRAPGGHRRFRKQDLLDYLDSIGLLYDDSASERKDVVYARVSSHEQKRKGDLDRQALYLVQHAPGLQNPVVMSEVGSGLNDHRKQLDRLIGMVCRNEIRNIYITYKDRLTRFGFHYLERIAEAHGASIIVVKDNSGAAKKSEQAELVEDMMALIASFSGKLYGMRSREKRKEAQADG